MHAKLKHHNHAQVVLMAALGIVLRPVPMNAKLKHHKVAAIVQHNVVENAIMNVLTDVDGSVMYHVGAIAKENAEGIAM